jgi:hypothetical protein
MAWQQNSRSEMSWASRKFHLGVGTPFGAHGQILNSFSWTFSCFFMQGSRSDKRIGLFLQITSLNGQRCEGPVTIHYCLIWDSPNMDSQVPIFMSPRNRVVQLYPCALSSLFISSYDTQGYGGILTCVHTELSFILSKSKLSYHWRSVNQSALVSGQPLGPVTNFSFSFTEIIFRHLEFY